MSEPSKDLLSEILKIHHEAARSRDKKWREWLDRMIPDWDAIEGFDDNPPPDRR